MKTYAAIDLKSYYASAECAARRLDPLTTNLVVADPSRTEKTICLAVSPSLKALGIPGRARLFEVAEKIRQINAVRLQNAVRNHTAASNNGRPVLGPPSFQAETLKKDPTLEVSYLIAPPRMSYYMETSAKIYGIYLKYVAPEDIHVYSIDEVFIDMTSYLKHYQMSARDLVKTMIREVLYATGITATAGIGTNLYLCKLAMDIVAKRTPPDQDGVRIAELDEASFRYLLWDHRPLTDFWQTGPGIARRLEKHGIHTMGQLARASLTSEDMLFKEFGIDAEILIDHAWGIEPCEMSDIKAYQPSENSVCEGQVLSRPYSSKEAQIIVREMADSLALRLSGKGLVTDSLTLSVGYDRENCALGSYTREVRTDHYGRQVPKSAHGTIRLETPSSLSSQMISGAVSLFGRIADPKLLIRRIAITANRVTKEPEFLQLCLFTDQHRLEKEKHLQDAVLELKKRFGKNAVLKGTSFLDSSTMRQRNCQIGGHRA